MKPMLRGMAVVMALALGLAAFSPALAQDGGDLTPFANETFGLQGVIPQGWSEAAPGAYARGAGPADPTSLIIQAVPGMAVSALTGVLLPQLGIETLPESAGSLETAAYTWTLYVLAVEQQGASYKADLALADGATGATLVLLITLADDYEALHEPVFLPVVEALAPIGTGAGAADDEAAAEEVVFEDPAGRFTVPVPTNWRAEARDGYSVLYSPEDLIQISIVVVETADPGEALAQAWALVQPGFDQPVTESAEIPAPPLEHFGVYTYETDDASAIVQAQVRVYDGWSYVAVVHGDLAELQRREAQLTIVDSGFEIVGMEVTDLSTVEARPLTDALIAEFEAYVETALASYETPGAAVAIVRDGEVVYAQGFGVRNPQGDPITPETLMAIGSTSKTMTTLLMAQMVDEGTMAWDTPVTEILPTFAVADPAVTQAITMENLVCACTGVPRRDGELIFNAADLSAEGIIESLATFEFFTDFGEAFQYSNQMVAAAGYLTALAAGGEYGTLGADYVRLMEDRVFAPLGMDSTTFSYAEIQASENHAVPYGLFMDFTFQPLPYKVEEFWLEPIGPAGAVWSTVLDMSQYLIMELNEGLAANGARIVSTENLRHTWQPQIAMSAADEYGLGWIISDYNGLQMLSHAGATLGFTSEFVFLPERDLGVVVLTNQRLSFLNGAVVTRLFEMLFGQPYTADDTIRFGFDEFRDQFLAIRDRAERTVAPDVAALAGGSFTNEALGDVTVRLDDEGVLIFDAGEFQSELWRDTGGGEPGAAEEAVSFFFYNPPLAPSNVRFAPDEAGVYQMTLGDGADEYAFERVK